MKADREAFAGRISILDRNALLALALSLYDEMEEMRLKHLENERISTEAHIQFSELNAKYTAAIAENENLKKLLQKEIEKKHAEDKVHLREKDGRVPVYGGRCGQSAGRTCG